MVLLLHLMELKVSRTDDYMAAFRRCTSHVIEILKNIKFCELLEYLSLKYQHFSINIFFYSKLGYWKLLGGWSKNVQRQRDMVARFCSLVFSERERESEFCFLCVGVKIKDWNSGGTGREPIEIPVFWTPRHRNVQNRNIPVIPREPDRESVRNPVPTSWSGSV